MISALVIIFSATEKQLLDPGCCCCKLPTFFLFFNGSSQWNDDGLSLDSVDAPLKDPDEFGLDPDSTEGEREQSGERKKRNK